MNPAASEARVEAGYERRVPNWDGLLRFRLQEAQHVDDPPTSAERIASSADSRRFTSFSAVGRTKRSDGARQ